MMATRVGRGRARGGRVIPQAPLLASLQGRVMLGRGISIVEPLHQPLKLMRDSSVQYDPGAFINDTEKTPVKDKNVTSHKTNGVGKETPKELLEEQLLDFVTKKEGFLIKITMDYFDYSDDVQYYFDKVMDSLLKSPFLIEEFTKELGLITCLKEKGDDIKNGLFKKIQLSYIDMKILMDEDTRELSAVERQRVRGFCDLLGCVYARLRVKGSEHRFRILAKPVVHALAYLLKVNQLPELIVFNKLLVLNYSALEEEAPKGDVNSVNLDLRSAILSSTDNTRTLWLMSALDLTCRAGGRLPAYVNDFYSDQLGGEWTLITKLNAYVPFQENSLVVVKSRMNKFDEIVFEKSRP